MSSEAVETLSSRRSLLGLFAGAAAAALGGVVGRASPVAAGAGDVKLNQTNNSTVPTEIQNATWNSDAFRGNTSGPGGIGVLGQNNNSGYGVAGESFVGGTGVYGHSSYGTLSEAPAKTGVYGYAAQDASARGVTGQTTVGRGVNGIATSGTGVFGKATTGEGMRGTSDGSNGVAGKSGSGVASGLYGENTAGGFGTYGRSNAGSTSAFGVYGESTYGTGVAGSSTSGVGILATAPPTGTAFRADGRISFSTSGLTTVPVGAKSKTITPGTGLVTSSRILCTLESNQPGLAIQRLVKNTAADTFTVYLSAVVTSGESAKVAWFVIG